MRKVGAYLYTPCIFFVLKLRGRAQWPLILHYCSWEKQNCLLKARFLLLAHAAGGITLFASSKVALVALCDVIGLRSFYPRFLAAGFLFFVNKSVAFFEICSTVFSSQIWKYPFFSKNGSRINKLGLLLIRIFTPSGHYWELIHGIVVALPSVSIYSPEYGAIIFRLLGIKERNPRCVQQ